MPRGVRKTTLGQRPKPFSRRGDTHRRGPSKVVIVNPRPRGGLGIGAKEKQFFKFRYTETVTLNPGASGTASHYFSANGLWDPNVTGTGHQPMLFDQMMQQYQHYQVVGSKCNVQAINTATGTVIPGTMGIFLDDNTTFSYALTEGGANIIEGNQRCSNWMLTGGINTRDSQTNGVNAFFSTKKDLGAFGHGKMEDTLRGSATANPTEQMYYVIWFSSVNNIDPINITFMVDIVYTALLTEKRFTAQS